MPPSFSRSQRAIMLIFELLYLGRSAAGISVISALPGTPLPTSARRLGAAAGLEFALGGRHACLHMHRVAPVSA